MKCAQDPLTGLFTSALEYLLAVESATSSGSSGSYNYRSCTVRTLVCPAASCDFSGSGCKNSVAYLDLIIAVVCAAPHCWRA